MIRILTLLKMYTVKVLHIMHASSLGSTKFSMNLGLLMETMFLFHSHIVLYFEIQKDTFVIPSVYCWE